MRTLYIVLLSVLCSIKAYAQPQIDTTTYFFDEERGHIAIRADAGWNKSWFQSLGVSYLYVSPGKIIPSTFVIYAAGEINEAKRTNPIPFYYGYKAGVEFSQGFILGIELKNLTDFKGYKQFVATPKFGLSIFSLVQFTYGYNLFNTQKNIFMIGASQFAFSFNIPPGVFKNRRPKQEAAFMP